MNGVVLSDSRFQHADLGAVAAGLDKHGVLLNGKNSADDAAVGDNLISNLNAVEHVLHFLVALLLRADYEEIEEYDDKRQRNEHCEHACHVCTAGCVCRRSCGRNNCECCH